MVNRNWIRNNLGKYLIWKNNLRKSRRDFIKNNPHFQDGSKNPMYGKPPWNKHLTKETDRRIAKYAQTRKSLIKAGLIIPVWSGKKHSLLHRMKNSVAKRGINNPMKREEVRTKVSETLKKKWKCDGKFVKKMLSSFCHLHKNNFENEFSRVCKMYKLPFIYTGNGSFWIGPCISGKRRNPDFRHLAERKVILLNGEHWHTKEGIDEQIKDYENVGYEVLSIWDKEWTDSKDDVIRKLKGFSN